MNPVLQFLRLVQERAPSSGMLVSVSGAQATVNTGSKIITCSVGVNTLLRKGDKVAIVNGTIVAKLKGDDEVPHYTV